MMIEVMVSLLIFSFGLLGYSSLQARAAVAQYEALQRTQALVLVDDMVSRISANRADAADYVTNGLIGTGVLQNCAGLTNAALDLCEWANLIRGSTETRNGLRVGAMTVARGCITQAADTSDRYTIAVAWQGVSASGAPASSCGSGDAAYPSENLRRVVTATVCIGRLRDPAIAAAVARC
jgi:type IV pilus assembly protein PilV